MDIVDALQVILDQLDAIAGSDENLSFEFLGHLDDARYYVRQALAQIQQEQQQQ